MLTDLIKQKESLERQIIRAAVAYAEFAKVAVVTLAMHDNGTHEWKPELWEVSQQLESKEQALLRATNELIQFLTIEDNKNINMFEHYRKELGIVEKTVEIGPETP